LLPSYGTVEYTGPITAYYLANSAVPKTPAIEAVVEDDAELVAKAKLKALSYIDTGSYSFGEDVGEYRETVRFLKNPLSSMVRLGEQYRKTYYKKFVKRTAKWDLAAAHAEVYAQYRFALSPLIRSSYDAIKALRSGNALSQRASQPVVFLSQPARTLMCLTLVTQRAPGPGIGLRSVR
jgi:hypothetical protein